MTNRELGQGLLTGLLVLLALPVGANSALDLMAARKRAVGSPQNQIRQLWGQNTSAFEAVSLNGDRVVVPDPRQATVLYFFSTRCGACAVNREQWERLAGAVPAGTKVVALSFEAVDTLRQYVRSADEASMTVMPDISQFPEVRQSLRMVATPTLYVFDHTGILRYSHVGVFNERTAGLAIRALDSR